TPYPNTSPGTPANIAHLTLPVASSVVADPSFADYIVDFPNNLKVEGYQGLYEFRLYTSSPSQLAGTSYYRAVVKVDILSQDADGTPTGTWAVVYPVATTPTTTTLAASPQSPAPHGTSVTLTATVVPPTVGQVHFLDGTTDLGAGTYNATTGTATM